LKKPSGPEAGPFNQEEAAHLLGVSERTLRRYLVRYEEDGIEGLYDKRISQALHRKRRERTPVVGMMLHQDGSRHQWVEGINGDLIVTMDDATTEHFSMFFVDQEGAASSFTSMLEVLEKHGLCCSLYTDRGNHYWYTPSAGGKVDKNHATQFGRAMHQLGIEMIAAYSPQARPLRTCF